jgi:hypothetical protein
MNSVPDNQPIVVLFYKCTQSAGEASSMLSAFLPAYRRG